MTNVGTAIAVNLFYFDKPGQEARELKKVDSATPAVRNFRVINVSVNGAKTAGEIIGLPEMPITNVLLDNVDISAKTGMTVQDANGVELRNVKVKAEMGDPLTIRHAEVKRLNTKPIAD